MLGIYHSPGVETMTPLLEGCGIYDPPPSLISSPPPMVVINDRPLALAKTKSYLKKFETHSPSSVFEYQLHPVIPLDLYLLRSSQAEC